MFFQNIPVMPTYHPAYLLRSPSKKKDAWEDLQKVMATIKKINTQMTRGNMMETIVSHLNVETMTTDTVSTLK